MILTCRYLKPLISSCVLEICDQKQDINVDCFDQAARHLDASTEDVVIFNSEKSSLRYEQLLDIYENLCDSIFDFSL